MKSWDVVKEVSAQPVRQEASRLFALVLAGDPAHVAAARAVALGPGATTTGEPFLWTVSPPYDEGTEKRLRHADLIVSVPGGPGLTDFRPADTILSHLPEDLPRRVLERRPDLRIPLGRRLPGFRALAAEQVIREVSRVNAEFAVVSGVSGAVPFLAPLFPAMAGADILMLTKNQVLMIFRLAAIYDQDLDLRARWREVGPVVGGAFGWRTVARELAGVLPGGIGLPVRAGIAFAGTYAVGRGVQMVFDEGRRPERRELRRIYEEGRHLAQGVVASLKRSRQPEEAAKSLPEPPEAAPPAEPRQPEP